LLEVLVLPPLLELPPSMSEFAPEPLLELPLPPELAPTPLELPEPLLLEESSSPAALLLPPVPSPEASLAKLAFDELPPQPAAAATPIATARVDAHAWPPPKRPIRAASMQTSSSSFISAGLKALQSGRENQPGDETETVFLKSF
jgi:hypothetical protein